MISLALDPALHIALRAAFALLFVRAAGHKLRDLAAFRAALGNYQLLPERALAPAAVLLIAAELGVAAGLCLPDAGAAIGAAALLALYAAAIVVNLLRGRRDIDCGCGGAARHQPLSPALAVRNVVLVIAALASAVPVTARLLTWLDGSTIALSVATVALLYAGVDGLLAHAPQNAALAAHHAAHTREAAHA